MEKYTDTDIRFFSIHPNEPNRCFIYIKFNSTMGDSTLNNFSIIICGLIWKIIRFAIKKPPSGYRYPLEALISPPSGDTKP